MKTEINEHTHTHTAETTGFSLGTVKNIHLSTSFTTLSVVEFEPQVHSESPDEHFWDSLLPFELGSLSSASQKQTYTLFIACNFSSLVNMSNEFSSLGSVTLNRLTFCPPLSQSVQSVLWRFVIAGEKEKKKKEISTSLPLDL